VSAVLRPQCLAKSSSHALNSGTPFSATIVARLTATRGRPIFFAIDATAGMRDARPERTRLMRTVRFQDHNRAGGFR
jgi:hypothetical protein